LASIGSVARVRILSRAEGADAGSEVRADGGRLSPVAPAAAPPGTLIEVRDLFYNVPARRRFLRTPQGERSRCVDVFTKLALAHPELGFTLRGGREIRLDPGEGLELRVRKLFGKTLAEQCLPVELERGGIAVHGLVGDPDAARRDRTQMQLFLNGRPFQDRGLARAIQDAFHDYLMGGKFPVAFLFLTMDPARADVNVHPQKSEVRFTEQRLVFSVVRQAVQEALQGRATRIRSRSAEHGGSAGIKPVTGFPALPEGLFGRGLPGSDAPGKGDRGVGAGHVEDAPAGFGDSTACRAACRAASPAGRPGRTRGRGRRSILLQRSCRASGRRGTSRCRCGGSRSRRFLQVKNLYLVFETDEGMAIVDQHALHERVLYERLLTEYRAGEVRVQRLLIPLLVELTPADKELLLEQKEGFAEAGLLFEDFGGNTIKLEGYPAALRRIEPRHWWRASSMSCAKGPSQAEPEDVRERFHHAACRAAIMAGDRLSDDEIAVLLEEASKLAHPDNCPHGRPTCSTSRSVSWSAGSTGRSEEGDARSAPFVNAFAQPCSPSRSASDSKLGRLSGARAPFERLARVVAPTRVERARRDVELAGQRGES
jgi:DNA mismatch repair protein MutL